MTNFFIELVLKCVILGLAILGVLVHNPIISILFYTAACVMIDVYAGMKNKQ